MLLDVRIPLGIGVKKREYKGTFKELVMSFLDLGAGCTDALNL